MKIINVTEYYRPTIGGTEELVHDVSYGLSKLGYNVEVVAPSTKVRYNDTKEGFSVRRFNLYNLMPFESVMRFSPGMFSYLRHSSANIFHFFSIFFLTTYLKPSLKKTPYALTITSSHFQRQASGFVKRLRMKIADIAFVRQNILDAAAIIGHNKEICDFATHIGNNNVYFVEPAVDTELFKPMDKIIARRALGFEENTKIILYVGRLVEFKGIVELVRAFAKVFEKMTDLQLVIVGTGMLMDKLQSLSKTLHIESRIKFIGPISRSILPLYYNAADITIVYSSRDATPFPSIESISCGTPVISSNVGGLPWMVKNGETGYVLPLGQVDVLTSAISEMLSDCEKIKAMSSRCRRDALERFNLSKMVKDYSNIYNKISG